MPEKTRVMWFSPLSMNRVVKERAGRGAALRAQALAAPAGPRPRRPGGEGHPRGGYRLEGRHYTLRMAATSSIWSPSSWRERRALHQPGWPDDERAVAVRQRLAKLPPLVFAGEARALRSALAGVGQGRAFVLQAGDCAESFHDFSAITIREKLKIMLQMSAVLTYGGTLPIVKVGRIAGQ